MTLLPWVNMSRVWPSMRHLASMRCRQGDNSMLILLTGVVAIVVTICFLAIWLFSISSGENARFNHDHGHHVNNFFEDVKSLTNENIHFLLLAIPVVGILIFTFTPLIYMILMAFTSYDNEHQPPGHLFDWVGPGNFKTLLFQQ